MRHSGAEKLETIRLVEDSELSVKLTMPSGESYPSNR